MVQWTALISFVNPQQSGRLAGRLALGKQTKCKFFKSCYKSNYLILQQIPYSVFFRGGNISRVDSLLEFEGKNFTNLSH